MDILLECDLIHDCGNVTERNFPTSCERLYTKSDKIFTTSGQMNATTISLLSSHASPVSHPSEIAQLILNATEGHSTG